VLNETKNLTRTPHGLQLLLSLRGKTAAETVNMHDGPEWLRTALFISDISSRNNPLYIAVKRV
jgi:hypothetical protein